MRTLNLGILAHVDAGKTTLTERLLYSAGAIDHVGSVDAGTTQTDSLDLERERGITIKSAVASFVVGDLAINIVDTPGHPDFIAEVERVLGVLDGAVLVVSAVEGVQPQTPLLMRALQRLGVPTLIFVNKIDRAGADDRRVLEAMARRLSPGIVPMGSVHGIGTRDAQVRPTDPDDRAQLAALTEVLAERDDAVLRDYVRDELSVPYGRLRQVLAAQTRRVEVHPVFFGSATRGIGVDALSAGIAELLPAADGDPDGDVSGRVFKIERTTSGERVAYVRLFSGTLQPRRRVQVGESATDAKPNTISVFAPRSAGRKAVVSAGEMARVWGLGAVRVGDAIGVPPPGVDGTEHHFPLPTLESVVVARHPDQSGSLRAALAQLAEQDPLINVRQDDTRHEISVSLYGDVQKEVIQSTLERDYGIAADFRETTTLCIERPARAGEADQVIRAKTKTNITGRSSPLSTNPFTATLGLRVEPAAPGSGVSFATDVDVRLVPLYLYKTTEAFASQMEAYVREAFEEGLCGWQVTDCRVTMWDCGYMSPASGVQDFRRLTHLVLLMALERAGTWVCEPLANLSLELPSASAQGVIAALGRLGGRVRGQFSNAGMSFVDAVLPVARVRSLQHQLVGLTGGEGVLETRFGGYQPVGGTPPRRPRTEPSPLNRDEWLAHLAHRA
ncbi:MAG TPA: translation factor GTPase family protein [Candidatus Limnocylindrales bacterium]|nr:translation factor GTPase family protein [Candidatus Limnocylindrales bacterium]